MWRKNFNLDTTYAKAFFVRFYFVGVGIFYQNVKK